MTLLAPMKCTGMHVSTTSGKEWPKSSGKHPEKIEKGREVVKTVCTQLANAHIFPTLDSSLLEIVAKHESNFGNDKTDAKGRAPVGGGYGAYPGPVLRTLLICTCTLSLNSTTSTSLRHFASTGARLTGRRTWTSLCHHLKQRCFERTVLQQFNEEL